MSLRASTAIARHELRVMKDDPSTAIFVIVMPLVFAALMQRLFQAPLEAEGVVGATGAEFAVPGMAVAFVAFGAGYAGFAFFRDHGWGTWDRLRATPASSLDIFAGKVAPAVGLSVVQMLFLFIVAVPLFDFRVSGSWLALVLVVIVLALCLNAFGVAVMALSRTMQQLNALGSAGGFALATLGGAFVPVSAMPGWAQAVAPAMPTYWAMEAFRDVVIESGGFVDVVLPVALMLGFTALFAGLAAAKFRFEESKVYYG
jgi:ABC-2 type transport system permease protein